MSKTSDKPDLRLHVAFEEDPYGSSFGTSYAHVRAMPAVLARDKYGQHEWFAHAVDSYSVDGPQPDARMRNLDGLKVSAQADNHSGDDNGFYGFELTFEPSRKPTLHELERILPVMRRIDKRMTALRDQYGYPRDLAAYLSYLATAVCPGVKRPFIRRVDDGHDIEGTGYRSMDTEALRWWVDRELKRWREKVGVSTER